MLALSYTENTYTTGQPGIAASVFGGPTVKILSFVGGALTGDTKPPVRTNGQPTGVLAAGTSQTSLSLTTDKCRLPVCHDGGCHLRINAQHVQQHRGDSALDRSVSGLVDGTELQLLRALSRRHGQRQPR